MSTLRMAVAPRRARRASAGGQLEQPSEVKSSDNDGARFLLREHGKGRLSKETAAETEERGSLQSCGMPQ